jgi:hypothetical protein
MTRFLRRGGIALLAVAMLAPLGGQPSLAAKPQKFIDLDKVPKPKITGKEIIAGLEQFVADYGMRQSTLPFDNAATAEFLRDEAKKNGFKSRILELPVDDPVVETVRVVEAIKKGTTKPNEWITFIAHYDTVEQTLQGAYDDGSGTNMMRFFGKAFSKVKTNRSIALLWFDAEEQGLLASQVYAERLKKKGQKIAGAFGFDMVGIGFPARYCICVYHGPMPQDAAWAVPIARYVNFDYLKFPEGDGGPGAAAKWPVGTDGHVCICGPNIRNSDESNFAEQGYLTMRWAGMRTAVDYPGYHQPWDTVPFMELVAGGRDLLEQGTENTFLSAYYTAFVVDNL